MPHCKKIKKQVIFGQKKLETSLLLTTKKYMEHNQIKKQLRTTFHFQIIVKLTMLILDGFGNL